MGKVKRSINKQKTKTVIGWVENVDLPDLDIWDFPAKIDTGARTSSLHVEDVEVLPHNQVKFTIILDDRKPERNKSITTKIERRTMVRTSHLYAQNRIFIKTQMKLGPVERDIEINLMDRSDLRYRLILGRSAVAGSFVIDAKKTGLQSK